MMKSGWIIGLSGFLAISTVTALAEAGGDKTAPHSSNRDASVKIQPLGNLIPAAMAEKSAEPQALRVGARIDKAAIHPVTRPGLYGMGKVPAGSAYGIVDGNLVRYNPDTLRLQSVIRSIDVILD